MAKTNDAPRPGRARDLHIALNVAYRRAGAESVPACDGPDCDVCQVILAALAAVERKYVCEAHAMNVDEAGDCPYCRAVHEWERANAAEAKLAAVEQERENEKKAKNDNETCPSP